MGPAQGRPQKIGTLAFLLPGGLLLALFVVWPILSALRLAFYDYNAFSSPRFVGMGNFAEMLSNPNFWSAARNSLLFLVVTPALACASLLAALLVDRPGPGVRAFRAAFFVPVVLPMVIAGIAWKLILADDVGVLNKVLLHWHLIERPVYWLSGEKLALWSVMLVTFWKGVGYYMVMFLSGLQAIPKSLHEAAQVDGASQVQIFRRITLPLLKPTLALVLVLSAAAAVRVFDEVYVLTGGGPLKSSETLLFYMYSNALAEFPPRIGFACAVGVLTAAVAAAVAGLRKR